MNKFVLFYIIGGLCTVASALLGLLKAVQHGAIELSGRSRSGQIGLCVGIFISILQTGICWPLYWIGLTIAKIVDQIENGNPPAAGGAT